MARILRGSLYLVPGIIMVNVLWNIRFHALSTKLLWLRLLHFFGHQHRLPSGCAFGGQIHSGYDCEPSQPPTCGKALIHHLLLFTPFTTQEYSCTVRATQKFELTHIHFGEKKILLLIFQSACLYLCGHRG